MSITVGEALTIGRLKEAAVLGGKEGLTNVVRAVDIIDVPDAAIWFRRDSLLSTTFYALKDNLHAQLKMLEDIAECGGAGLIIFSPERYITQIDKRLIAKANELKLPLLQMPDCSYIDVIVPVMSKILDKQVASLEYAHEVHGLMMNFVLKGRSLSEIVSSLSSLIEAPVVLADHNLALLDYEMPTRAKGDIPLIKCLREGHGYLEVGECYPPGILEALAEEKQPVCHRCQQTQEKFDYLFPIMAGNTFYGLFIIPGLEQELESNKKAALEAASLAVSLNILKENELKEAKRKNELDFFNELLLGNLKSRENILAQAAQLGLDLDGPYCLILVEINHEALSPLEKPGSKSGVDKEILELKLQRQLRSALDMVHPQNITTNALGSYIVLLRLDEAWSDEERLRSGKLVMEKLSAVIRARMPEVPVCMTMGRIYSDIERVSSSYIQAWEAMEIGKKMLPPDFTILYSDVDPYRYVKRFLTSSAAESLYQRIYEPLLKYDHEKKGDLVATLETYIECNYSRSQTAKKLFIHRNTLNYRLNIINELLGQDVDQISSFPFLLASIGRKLSL